MPGARTVALVGNPNVGKSVIFSYLTGKYVTVSNYPGTTVEMSEGVFKGLRPRTALLDTPGVNNLIPMSEDEAVTRDVLLTRDLSSVVQVGDAKNLKRSLLISLQMAEMGIPFALVLNMWDEASDRRIRIDIDRLAGLLGVDVIPAIATQRWGLDSIASAVSSPKRSGFALDYGTDIESSVKEIVPVLDDCARSSGASKLHASTRSVALMIIAGDMTLREWLNGCAAPDAVSSIEREVNALRSRLPQDPGISINNRRLAAVEGLMSEVYSAAPSGVSGVHSFFGRIAMHPFWGVVILAAVLFTMYQFVGVLGAGYCVDFLENTVFGGYVNPALKVLTSFLPGPVGEFFTGEYGLFTMALTYAFAIILPIVFTFFVFFGLLEDSGYLPRLAVMANNVFKLMGLNGKAALPMVLGLGCGTMATLSTRILETKRERLIATILLAVGVPCSAQLGVVFGLLAQVPVQYAAVWFGTVVLVLFITGLLAAKVLPGEAADFFIEIPPVRVPEIKNILLKTWGRMRWYLVEAVPLFAFGTVLLFFMDKTGVLYAIEKAVNPIVEGVLGLPSKATASFIVGFLRRDYGAAGLRDLWNDGLMDHRQLVVSLVAMTLFVPCVAHFFVTIKERGLRTGVAIFMLSLFAAVLAGAVVNLLFKLV